ncbi:MAG: glutathione S-transferase N-terminal domain-containing protein, partial [Pseudomonadota bacterium]
MMKLYAIPVSLYCAKLRIVLRHKNLTWEEVTPPGGYGSETYKDLVPGGSLPALDHDGHLLSDSEAIAEYLNELQPEPDMLPGDILERARLRERSRFHD